jgi:TRAP-type C4-dicarboxylate transport system permease small subunit
MEIFHRLVDAVSQVTKVFVLILATGIFAIILFTVVSRYGFTWVLSWSEEVPRYLLIWVSFLSAAVGVDISDHIAFDLIYRKFTGLRLKILQFVINGSIVGFGVLMLIYGIVFVRDFGPDWMESIPFTNVWYYTAMPISGALIVLFAIRNQLGLWFGNEGRAQVKKFEIVD